MRLAALMALFAVAATPAAAQSSRAAAYLMGQEIAEGCGGGEGTIEPSGFVERDLTGDGRADLLVAHEAIRCLTGGAHGRSLMCGVQVCSVRVYVREGALLALREDLLGAGVTVDGSTPPVVSGFSHGGAAWSFRWTGRGFE